AFFSGGPHNPGARPGVFYLPLSVLPATRPPDATYWQRRLGLSPSDQVVLHLGGLHPHYLVPEIIEAAPHMPREAVLVLHGKRYGQLSPSGAGPGQGGRVHISSELVEPDELHALASAAAMGVAFYSGHTANL